MASITSLSNASSASSIYGNRNVLSGLASGMDTESMIENAVAGIKLKMQRLQQKRTKVEWQQEAYRSIIDKMANFTQKYTSYASSTNLASNGFFSNAVKTTTGGTYADKVTATGRTSSEVQLLGVKQLATAASYRVGQLGGVAYDQMIQGAELDLAEKLPQSKVSGSLTLKYGGTRSVDLEFGELETYKNVDELAAGIQKKLSNIQMTTSSGDTKKASDMISVVVQNGNITFKDKQNAGNAINISSASGKIKDTLGIEPGTRTTSLNVGTRELIDNTTVRGDYLSGKTLNVTLDGVTKKVTMPEYKEDMSGKAYLEELQKSLEKAFGTGKIKVDTTVGGDDGKFAIKITAKQDGSTVSVTSNAAEAMGLPKNGDANYINTGKKLGELLGDKWDEIAKSNSPLKAEGEIRPIKDKDGNTTHYLDSKGNRVKQTYDGTWQQVDEEGEALYDFQVNGVSVGKFSKNSALENVITAINSNADAGVKVSYSKMTNEFRFTATETGETGQVSFGGLGKSLFGDPETSGSDYVRGQDAIVSMTVNGKKLENVSRSSNTFDVDGMKITLKGTFNYEENEDGTIPTNNGLVADAEKDAVTFQSSSDADKIVDAIKSMVEDYNAMVTEIKNAYSTMPATKNGSVTGARYEPLTEEDKADMSESEIKAYEEKAKQGILFGDSNLSGLYGKMLSAITPGGSDGQTLREIGLSTSYSEGLTTLTLDETALRSALEKDPDKVTSAFTKSAESGSSSNGLMQNLLKPLNTYAKTTGEPKGVLITHAGSIKAPTTINSNTLQSQMNSIDKQLDRLEDKMSSQIDRYTTQFSRLEQLIAEMNSQASAMAGLMGGSSGGY